MNINFLYSLINVCSELIKILDHEANITALTTESNDTTKIQMALDNNPPLLNNSTNFILEALNKGEKQWGKGINISKWQREINGSVIRIDKNAISAEAYHVLTITASPEGQFKNINSQLEKVNFDKEKNSVYISVSDPVQKGTKDQVTNTLTTLIDLLKTEGYVNIGINTNNNIWKNYIDENKYDFSQHNLWISHWTNKSEPTIPEAWKDKGWGVWQYTCNGHVKGIKGSVCLDHLNLPMDIVGEDTAYS